MALEPEGQPQRYAEVGTASQYGKPTEGTLALRPGAPCGVVARVESRWGSRPLVLLAGVVTTLAFLLLPGVQVAWASRPLRVGSCTVAVFDKTAGPSAAGGFTQVDCDDGWALAVGPEGANGTLGVFQQAGKGWTEVRAITPKSWEPSTGQFAGLGVSPALLGRLAKPFPLAVRQLVSAGALVEGLSTNEARLGATGLYQASAVLRVGQRSWFVMAGAESAPPPFTDQSVSTPAYPDSELNVYLWHSSGWVLQGTVRGWMGPIEASCCGIVAVSLTGSHDPDFAMTSGGAADTDWLAIASDVGGAWRLVPFDYGYTLTTVVNGQPAAGGVTTMVDATSSASGPTTWLFEKYEAGAFRPAVPPGHLPACSFEALTTVAELGAFGLVPSLAFSASACVDGWALALGTGPGYTGQVVGLFEASNAGAMSPKATGSWRVVELDNGDSVGSYPGIYDIPLSLLRKLAGPLGPALRPELAIASLIATPAMTGIADNGVVPDGVVPFGDSLWYVTETATGREEAPGAIATVYRWSGNAWVEEGRVDRVPASLDWFLVGYGAWFEAVNVRGSADPGFVMENSGSARRYVLTHSGGAWHAAPYEAAGP